MSEQKNLIYDTVIIGGGQASLTTGYHLKQLGRDFLILDASDRIGDNWRKRWDSLVLFTTTEFNNFPGMDFPKPAGTFATKDDMADYLEAYAQKFDLPVRLNTYVESVHREGDTYIVQTTDQRFTARNVVVATGAYQTPTIPDLAENLSPSIQQLHSSAYQNPQSLQDGAVLVVGSGNSGAQIALDIAPHRQVWLSGRKTGHIPRYIFGTDTFWWLMHTINYFTANTFVGRRLKKKLTTMGMALVGISEDDLATAKIERVPRVTGIQNGKPVLEDGGVMDVGAVIWATGYHYNFDWINIPGFDGKGYPQHHRGIVENEPGLYFVGLIFQTRFSSPLIGGVGRDAAYIAKTIAQGSTARKASRANNKSTRSVSMTSKG
jgi:putative flavoprotein involved in K+ transport